METQNLLHSRSQEIPEGLYIELMNKLKIDFEKDKTEENKRLIVVVNKSIAKKVICSKKELVENIIKVSVSWEDREEVLIKVNRMSYWVLKEYCISRGVAVMKTNPRWQRQETIMNEHQVDRNLLRNSRSSPAVLYV